MYKPLNRTQLRDALDRIGQAAVENGQRLELAIYGGSALMLASNFRYASEDVDIAALTDPWPPWLSHVIGTLATEHGWAPDWLNDAVTPHLSALATQAADHLALGSFPRNSDNRGLYIYVPTAEYMLALKLKAMRVADPIKGPQESRDIVNLIKLLKLDTLESVLAVLAKYFPRSAADADKQRFLLKKIWNTEVPDAPLYPRRDL